MVKFKNAPIIPQKRILSKGGEYPVATKKGIREEKEQVGKEI